MPPSKPKLNRSLCLIVWNELEGCQSDVPQLPRHLFDEVYAVDGGSTDGTVAYLESQGIPVHRQPKRSLNAAYAHAVEKCSTDALVVFFPKATLDPSCICRFAELLDQGFELIVASRNLPGAQNEEDKHLFKPRKWGVMALSLATSLLWRREGPRIGDVLHGVKAFTLSAYRRMNISDSGVTIDLEMVVRAYRLRVRRIEFPVCETARIAGASQFRIWPTAKKLGGFLISEISSPPKLQ
jgi:hypothetical protein